MIISLSGRALVASARKAGLSCKVIDLFNDLDTQAYAGQCAKATLTGYHWQAGELLAGVAQLDPERRCGLVYGSGFEAQPDLLDRLARQRALWGNTADAVALVKDPWCLADLLRQLAIPHPEISHAPFADCKALSKRRGACGGSHVQWQSEAQAGDYYQRYVPGRSLSATILANGKDLCIVGYCEQWCLATEEQPFTYAGAVTVAPEQLPYWLREQVFSAARELVNHVEITGLWNIDFIADDHEWWLLEINPRPGMTFELHEQEDSLIASHIVAVQGQLPERSFSFTGYRGHAIVYAEESLSVAALGWPDWVRDRPRPGMAINAGQPLCTVYAEGLSRRAVRLQLAARSREIIDVFANGV